MNVDPRVTPPPQIDMPAGGEGSGIGLTLNDSQVAGECQMEDALNRPLMLD